MKNIKLTLAIALVPVLFFLINGNSGIYGLSPGAFGYKGILLPKHTVACTKSEVSAIQQVIPKKKQSVPTKKSASSKTKVSSAAKTQKNISSLKDAKGTVVIGTQTWAEANLDVITFRNGDTIPEARTVEEWVAAGKAGRPAWCYYNNDTVAGGKYGKLYNWYAVNDPRNLAPEGWEIPGNEDWTKLVYFLGGSQVAGLKMKSTIGWSEGNNGTNESGFTGLPGGYRVENGTFINAGKIGIWWSSSAGHSSSAYDYYLFMSPGLGRSTNLASRGESVRCLKK